MFNRASRLWVLALEDTRVHAVCLVQTRAGAPVSIAAQHTTALPVLSASAEANLQVWIEGVGTALETLQGQGAFNAEAGHAPRKRPPAWVLLNPGRLWVDYFAMQPLPGVSFPELLNFELRKRCMYPSAETTFAHHVMHKPTESAAAVHVAAAGVRTGVAQALCQKIEAAGLAALGMLPASLLSSKLGHTALPENPLVPHLHVCARSLSTTCTLVQNGRTIWLSELPITCSQTDLPSYGLHLASELKRASEQFPKLPQLAAAAQKGLNNNETLLPTVALLDAPQWALPTLKKMLTGSLGFTVHSLAPANPAGEGSDAPASASVPAIKGFVQALNKSFSSAGMKAGVPSVLPPSVRTRLVRAKKRPLQLAAALFLAAVPWPMGMSAYWAGQELGAHIQALDAGIAANANLEGELGILAAGTQALQNEALVLEALHAARMHTPAFLGALEAAFSQISRDSNLGSAWVVGMQPTPEGGMEVAVHLLIHPSVNMATPQLASQRLQKLAQNWERVGVQLHTTEPAPGVLGFNLNFSPGAIVQALEKLPTQEVPRG